MWATNTSIFNTSLLQDRSVTNLNLVLHIIVKDKVLLNISSFVYKQCLYASLTFIHIGINISHSRQDPQCLDNLSVYNWKYFLDRNSYHSLLPPKVNLNLVHHHIKGSLPWLQVLRLIRCVDINMFQLLALYVFFQTCPGLNYSRIHGRIFFPSWINEPTIIVCSFILRRKVPQSVCISCTPPYYKI